MTQMNVNEVLAQLRVQQGQATQRQEDEATTTDFAALLKNSIDTVNETQQQASELARAFETGETDVPLAEVMVSLQKASVSFQAMVEVRNKLVEAYKDIMNMQM
ncbi:flagellar hook-basal body complex protein FliE [Methylomarinovum caldicuralii]|uniref:Flagellar hook-basal body complex protein FliE n=1 Tax=Methylomarinovum caldicuralii TaxID=438856 RepID=A0AAU9BZ75_9GAMM|nr:flagellar hook-basal body complex protein FliE [Methylomarinovum caldicuralii]BCX81640.1 flagellar hook-basal body complex protein FliE [Methylomarinovum caldicuralii]